MVLGYKDNISLLGPLSLLHHRLLRLQVLHLDCRLLGCKYHNIDIPQFLKLRIIKKKDLGAAVEEEQDGWTSDGPSLKHNPPHKDMSNLVGKRENREQHSASQA